MPNVNNKIQIFIVKKIFLNYLIFIITLNTTISNMVNIVVVHPDLGIGGAERLIVDASKALQENGHSVRIYTSYHNKARCYEETRDGTLKVYTKGQWIPRSIFGKCYALMAYLKMIYIALYLIMFSKHDLVLCDQVSACIPVFKLDLRNRSKVIFYCHFPDQLLTSRETMLKSIYRKFIDSLEEWSTGLADIILVNSKFTSTVVKRTFKSLKDRQLTVLYPCVNVDSFKNYKPSMMKDCSDLVSKCSEISSDNFTFLSLNRFERKKDIALAIEALSECKLGFEQINKGGQLMKAHLIVAGGYDERLPDSVQYYGELKRLVNELDLNSYVTFVKSPSDNEKLLLLQMSRAVIYTPKNEHFGIVPLEAMAMSKPVIASWSGGPVETIETGITGLLCDQDKYSFAEAMLKLYSETKHYIQWMGAGGLKRVEELFSYEIFRYRLNELVDQLCT